MSGDYPPDPLLSAGTDPTRAPELQEAVRLTEKMILDVAGIVDLKQRFFAITEKLNALPPETIVDVLRILTYRSMLHDPRYSDFFQTISDVKKLAAKLGYGKMSEIYTLARRKSYEEVVRFLQILPAARKLGEDEFIEVDPSLQDLTLGHKRELARTRNPDLLDRLTNDQDPITISNLLQNPRVTVKEVVKIASKRPTSANILRVVYRSAKWANHYVVKMALVNNPYTPTEISMALLHFLMEADLIDVAENTILHEKLRQAAFDMIMGKRKSSGEGPPRHEISEPEPGPETAGE